LYHKDDGWLTAALQFRRLSRKQVYWDAFFLITRPFKNLKTTCFTVAGKMYRCITILRFPQNRNPPGSCLAGAIAVHYSELVDGRITKGCFVRHVKKIEEMKKESKKNKWLHVRLNQQEFDQLQVQFKATTCRKLSDFTRRKLLGQLLVGTYRNSSLDNLTEELAELKTGLLAAGNNFNQAVKKLHTLSKIKEFEHWLIGYEIDRRALLRQVEKVSDLISKAAEKW